MKDERSRFIQLYLKGLTLTHHGGNFFSVQPTYVPQHGIKYFKVADLFIENYGLQLAAESFYFGKLWHVVSFNTISALRKFIFLKKTNKIFFTHLKKNFAQAHQEFAQW